MSFIDRIVDARNARQRNYRQQQATRVAQEIRQSFRLSPMCSDYENLFAQVRPLINEMKMVRPFAVNERGERIKNPNKTPELNLLDYPNEEMGWAEFADLMFATWLTKDQLFIHVHKDKRDNVIGYSIIPSSAYTWNGHEFVWVIRDGDGSELELRKDEVMTLRFSRSPDDPFRGVSPATAARVWAQTDDMVAQYQRAFFENGAIPQTITFITASTREKYEQARYELESKLRGAENHNKTVYAWRQMLPANGQTMDQIEVKTIQAPNNTLAIKEIVDIVNDRLNKAVGVSNFLLGDDSSAKYSNAELSQQQFIRNRVFPSLVTFWSQFQFELDRITGGLGYAIQFELEIPELTERAKLKADTAKVNAETLTGLIRAGADASSAVKALELPEAWLQVASGIQIKALADNTTSTSWEPLLAEDSKSSSCSSHCQCSHDALELNETEQKLYQVLVDMAEAIAANDPGLSQDEVIARVVEILEAEGLKGEKKALTKMMTLIKNEEVRAEITAQLKATTLSAPIVDRIRTRASLIVKHYDAEVRDVMRTVLENTRALTAKEIEERLLEAIPRDRAKMIARTETVYAFKSVQIDDYQEYQNRWGAKLGFHFECTWRCRQDGTTCDVCAAMDGQTTTLGQAYAHLIEIDKDMILKNGRELEAGTTIEWTPNEWNDQGLIPQPHPNCRCYFDVKVVREAE